ncbi:MAG TPA: DUF222 domain-containing protein [Jatrophihabitantaceae bacterium]|nr:DUF222 domain-containing protein [Jatrophihabitantaceae bacterium]
MDEKLKNVLVLRMILARKLSEGARSVRCMARSVDQLMRVNPAGLTQARRVAHLTRLGKASARLAAQIERTIAAASHPEDERSIDREEIACAMRWSFPYTQSRIVAAHKLVDELQATLDALSRGRINPEHAQAAAEGTYQLDARQSGKVEARVLERAASQTVTEFKRSLTRAVHRVDPAAAEQKHQRAKAERGVSIRPLPDGMASLWSVHDAVTAEAMMTKLVALAGKPTAAGRQSGDLRSADARRADTLADLVLGTYGCDGGEPKLPTQHGRKPTVHLLVPLDIALGLSDLPGELLGYGPIPASLCREAVQDPSATIRRLVIGPLGELLDCSTVYEPSQALADRVILRDRTCRMPGCNRKACTCDLDHVVPFDGSTRSRRTCTRFAAAITTGNTTTAGRSRSATIGPPAGPARQVASTRNHPTHGPNHPYSTRHSNHHSNRRPTTLSTTVIPTRRSDFNQGPTQSFSSQSRPGCPAAPNSASHRRAMHSIGRSRGAARSRSRSGSRRARSPSSHPTRTQDSQPPVVSAKICVDVSELT